MGKKKEDRKEVLRRNKKPLSNGTLVEVLEQKTEELYQKHSDIRKKTQSNRDKRRNKKYADSETRTSSLGEARIKDYLIANDIKFYTEHTFEELRNWFTGKHLRFDFFLPEYKLCIEYDGIQHFKYVKDFHGKNKEIGNKRLGAQIKRDEIKNKFCKAYAINLLRINYQQYHKIESILKGYLEKSFKALM